METINGYPPISKLTDGRLAISRYATESVRAFFKRAYHHLRLLRGVEYTVYNTVAANPGQVTVFTFAPNQIG